MRKLIFIVSYNAEKHIEKVLSDIPPQFVNSSDCEVLLIDDASQDATREVAARKAEELGIKNIKILKNRINQGYGGNQKVGYQYAVREKFDAVAMLHGDWQYTPLALPDLFEPLEKDPTIDCVLGVRFGENYSPLKGGMPVYKFIGNRILTIVQNKLADAGLKEWHTGYRVYRVQTLAKIVFELNTNDFHFDTEIILQLLHRKSKIIEVNIPTRYGSEICHVNGMRYAKDVLKASLKYRLQRYNLFYDIRYHPETVFKTEAGNVEHIKYDPKFDYCSPHSLVCNSDELVPPGSKVLDLGCSSGYVAKYLAEEKKCDVTGVDIVHPSAVSSEKFRYQQMNLETDYDQVGELIEQEPYDVVMMLDVLEHLSAPEMFLLNLYRRPHKKPVKYIFSTANVAFIAVRMMLILGHFNYGQKGILDITHKRLFSTHTFKNLMEQTGFIVKQRYGIPFPFQALGLPKWISGPFEKLNRALIKISPNLFSYQTMVTAVPLSAPDLTLADTLANR